MALRKMQNPQLDLKLQRKKSSSINNGGDSLKKEDAGKLEHKKDFLDRIEKIEERERSSAAKAMEDKGKKKSRDKAEMVTDLSNTDKPEAVEIKKEDVAIKKDKNIHKMQAIDAKKVITDKEEGSVKKFALPKKEYVTLDFPEGFLWGTATSAYQTEGGIKNNWSIWETSGKRRKELMGAGKNLKDHLCKQACDSYNKYKEDIDLAARLNNNAIRFGIEWSRVQPKKDIWDVEVINHYRDQLIEAKKRGMTTVVTLWHWTIPVWFARENSWESDDSLAPFLEYVRMVIKELGSNIDYWVTLNEPMVPIGFGYIRGDHPPGRRYAILKAHKVFNNLVEAHIKSYKLIHDHFPNARVAIASLTDYFEPRSSWNPLDKLMVRVASYWHHRRFLKKIKNYLDFIGCNYYFHDRLTFLPPFKVNKNKRVNDMGWELYPEGIYHVLKYLSKFNVPILITENGIADADDDQRPDFIKNHLKYIHKAIEDGVDVRGYFHWSLMDNFEWAWGWESKFGLYEMDRVTFKRTARPSAKVYKEICGKNRIKVEK